MALPYAKIILARLSEELKPRGFRKNGQSFFRSVKDCVQIVNLQASQFGTSASQRYTLNLAVYSTRLEPLEKEAMKLKEYEGHWRSRIKDLTEDQRDTWWNVHSEDEAQVAGEAMASLFTLPLEAMDGIGHRLRHERSNVVRRAESSERRGDTLLS